MKAGVIGTAIAASLLTVGFPAACGSAGTAAPARAGRTPAGPDERYPYAGAQFSVFVSDSSREMGGDDTGFYQWMAKAYRRVSGRGAESLDAFLAGERRRIGAARGPARRAEAERELGERLHRLVKKAIPRFSLDRGFEFQNVVRYGERQCFLQAVLIAGLAQRAGMEAGVAMVSRNTRGAATNNGHAVTLAKLADGTDVIIDASDPEPLVRQQGLFARVRGEYRYLAPVFRGGSPLITEYRSVADGKAAPTASVRTLDVPFLRSQFYYYRGERVRGGPILGPPTPAGLAAAARHLEQSVGYCAKNPLAVYQLGRVRKMEGNRTAARRLLESAWRLYSSCGWVPDGPREALALARGKS
jgi:hypothetical protein